MNQQSQNKEEKSNAGPGTKQSNQPNQPNKSNQQPNQPEYKDKPIQETKDNSWASASGKTASLAQGQNASTATMEKDNCSNDKECDPKNENKANAQTISKDQLLEKINSNSGVQVVNVLSPEHYGKGFIKGSKKIPLDQLENRMGELDKNKEVVTYCAGYECSASMKAAEKLTAKGFKAKAYEGGIKEWSAAGLPTER